MPRDSEIKILEKYLSDHGTLAAGVMEGRGDKELATLLNELPLTLTVKIINILGREKAKAVIQLLEFDLATRIIEQINPLKADLILRNLNEKKRNEILNALDPQIAGDLRKTLYYQAETVGANMSTKILTIPENITIREALKRIKKNKGLSLPYVFVLKDDEKLLGYVDFQILITSELNDMVATGLKKNIPRLFAQVSVQTVLEHEGWLKFRVLPVVNKDDVFLGALTYESIHDKDDMARERFARQARMASDALGDLYKIGLSSFFRMADDSLKKPDQ